MSDFAHIFTPKDNSLTERVRSYRIVFEAFQNAKASLDHINEKSWSDQLGEKEEIEEAFTITQRSLFLATQSIDQSELSKALDQHLMSRAEIAEFTHLKRQLEMKDIRDGNKDSYSNKSSHKR